METDIEKVKHCVSLWLEGESTDQQEQFLKDYFSKVSPEEIPEELKSVAALFRGNAALGTERMPHTIVPPQRNSNRRLWWMLSSIAAVALVALLFVTQKDKLLNEQAPATDNVTFAYNKKTVVPTESSQNESQMTEQIAEKSEAISQGRTKKESTHVGKSAEIYGYDYDGKPITNEKEAMESVECLSYLDVFNENISTLLDF